MSLITLLKENIYNVYEQYAKDVTSNAKFNTWFNTSYVTQNRSNVPSVVYHPIVEKFKKLQNYELGYVFTTDINNATKLGQQQDKKTERSVFFNFENAILPYPSEFEHEDFEGFFSELNLNKNDEEMIREDFRQMLEDLKYNYTEAQRHRFYNEDDFNKNKTLKDLLDKHVSDKTMKKLKIKKVVFKSNVMPFYLKIENPFWMVEKQRYNNVLEINQSLYNDIVFNLEKGNTFNGMDNIKNIENYCSIKHGFNIGEKQFNFSSMDDVRDFFDDFNFDGIIIKDVLFMVFDQKNIKSVMNDGSFDTNDSNFMS